MDRLTADVLIRRFYLIPDGQKYRVRDYMVGILDEAGLTYTVKGRFAILSSDVTPITCLLYNHVEFLRKDLSQVNLTLAFYKAHVNPSLNLPEINMLSRAGIMLQYLQVI